MLQLWTYVIVNIEKKSRYMWTMCVTSTKYVCTYARNDKFINFHDDTQIVQIKVLTKHMSNTHKGAIQRKKTLSMVYV